MVIMQLKTKRGKRLIVIACMWLMVVVQVTYSHQII